MAASPKSEVDPVEPVEADSRWADSHWGGPRVALAGVLALAAALRLVGIEYGLPHGDLLASGEGAFVERAWEMSHGGGLDPHWFGVPSGLLDLLAAVQAPLAERGLLAARLTTVTVAVLAVAATWWLGQRYGTVEAAVAALVVAVHTGNVATSHSPRPEVFLTLAVAVTLGLLVRERLLWGALAAGVATSIAYPGVVLLVPVLVLGWGRWRPLAAAAGLFAAGFLAATPFAAVHPGTALDDLWQALRQVRVAGFGYENDHWAGIAFTGHLWRGFGPVLVVAVIGLGIAVAQRRRAADLVLLSYALAAFLSLLIVRSHHERYALLLVPPLAVLAARVRYLTPVTLLLLIVPLTWAIQADARLTRTDTRVAAAERIEERLQRGDSLALDAGLLPAPEMEVTALRLPSADDVERDLAALRARGVEYVLASGAVADEVAAAPELYPAAARFYAELARQRPVFRFEQDKRLTGPWVALYRL